MLGSRAGRDVTGGSRGGRGVIGEGIALEKGCSCWWVGWERGLVHFWDGWIRACGRGGKGGVGCLAGRDVTGR